MKNRPFEDLAATMAQKVTGSTVRDLVKLHVETVANAEAVAKAVKPRRAPARKARPAKVVTVTADPRVMATAVELAGGDLTRLTIEPDGSVIVWNHPRTTKPQDNR